MKYEQKSFSVGGSSKAYRDNWDRVFGKKPEAEDAAAFEAAVAGICRGGNLAKYGLIECRCAKCEADKSPSGICPSCKTTYSDEVVCSCGLMDRKAADDV